MSALTSRSIRHRGLLFEQLAPRWRCKAPRHHAHGDRILAELEARLERKREAIEGRLTTALNDGLRRIEEVQTMQGRNIELLATAMAMQAARQRDDHRALERRLWKMVFGQPPGDDEQAGADDRQRQVLVLRERPVHQYAHPRRRTSRRKQKWRSTARALFMRPR